MTIDNPEAYVANLWNWSILDGCFGDTSISPTDLDGFVERKGHFLILETKAPTTDLTDGQRLTFERLVQDSRFTVIIIWGQKNNPERLLVMCGSISRSYNPASLDTLRERVSAWFEWVDGPA